MTRGIFARHFSPSKSIGHISKLTGRSARGAFCLSTNPAHSTHNSTTRPCTSPHMTIYQRDVDLFEPDASEEPTWLIRAQFGGGVGYEFPISDLRKWVFERALTRGSSGLEFVNFPALQRYRVSLNLWVPVAISFAPYDGRQTVHSYQALEQVQAGELRVWPLEDHVPFALPLCCRSVGIDDADICDADAFLSAANLLKVSLRDAAEEKDDAHQTLYCYGPGESVSYLQIHKVALMIALIDSYRPVAAKKARTKRKPAKRRGSTDGRL